MKILYITEFFSITQEGQITGGVEARVFFLKKYLEKMGHQVEVIARANDSQSALSSFSPSIMRRIFFVLKGIISASKFDSDIIVGSGWVAFPIAFIVGKIKKTPVIFCYHDLLLGTWLSNYGLSGLLGEISERLFLALTPSHIIAVSQTTKNKLITYGVASDKISVVHNGIDPNEIKKIAKSLHPSNDICVVSRLVTYKRIDDMIKSLSLLKKKFPKISLVIIGQGPERKKLEKLVNNLKLNDNVKLLGHIKEHSTVLKFISDSKIFCLPSITEGFGIVIIEAAALGKPIVAAKIPAIVEATKNGQGTLLFAPKNFSDLAQKMETLLLNDQLVKELSTQSIKLSQKYYWENLAAEELKIYQYCLNK